MEDEDPHLVSTAGRGDSTRSGFTTEGWGFVTFFVQIFLGFEERDERRGKERKRETRKKEMEKRV